MLKQRLMTAAVLILIALAVLFYLPPPAFCILTAFISLAAAYEYTSLMGVARVSSRILCLIAMCFVLLNTLMIPILVILAVGCAWWVLALCLVVTYRQGAMRWLNSVWLRGLMGVMVIVPCWAALNYIRNQNDGIYALLFLLILVFGADSTAYFVGKQWGWTKLAPTVSPGKSVQGVIGAVFFSIIVTVVVLLFSRVSAAGWFWALALSIVTVLFSIVGDLFESVLKRHAGLKDSGQLLPGHGGILDRIDSLTAGAPMFAFGAMLLGIYL